MSDATLGSHDSQAAWTALGNRMRRNRRQLLSALLILGLYMGVQAWLRLRSISVLDDSDGTISCAAAVETPQSSVNPLAEESAAVAASEALAPQSQPPQSQPPQNQPSTSPAGKSRARSQLSAKQRRAAAAAEAISPVGPATPSASQRSAPLSARQTELEGPRATAIRDELLTGRAAEAPRAATRPVEASANTSEAVLMAVGGRFLGRWLVEWSSQGRAAAEAGLRKGAAALARFARRSPIPLGGGPRETVATSSPRAEQPRQGITATPRHEAPTPGVVIANPGGTGGSIHYLINGEEHTLRPGESQRLPPGQWRLEFDRGGDFGDQAYTVVRGHYRFQPTARGWELVSAP